MHSLAASLPSRLATGPRRQPQTRAACTFAPSYSAFIRSSVRASGKRGWQLGTPSKHWRAHGLRRRRRRRRPKCRPLPSLSSHPGPSVFALALPSWTWRKSLLAAGHCSHRVAPSLNSTGALSSRVNGSKWNVNYSNSGSDSPSTWGLNRHRPCRYVVFVQHRHAVITARIV